jgi:hypothetical protein
VELLEFLKPGFLFISFLIYLLSASCSGGSSQTSPDKQNPVTPKRDLRKKSPSSFQDSLIVKSRSVIFFEPDSLQMEKIKMVNDKAIFESLTHDCFYQMKYARTVLEKYWQSVPVLFASKIRWLIFIKSNGADSTIDLNKIDPICGVYLFDPQKNPARIDMTNIETQLHFYFGKK